MTKRTLEGSIWEHFSRKEEEGVCLCNYCQKSYKLRTANNSSNASLWSHLEAVHVYIFQHFTDPEVGPNVKRQKLLKQNSLHRYEKETQKVTQKDALRNVQKSTEKENQKPQVNVNVECGDSENNLLLLL